MWQSRAKPRSKSTTPLGGKLLEIVEHLCGAEHNMKADWESAMGSRIDLLFEGYEMQRKQTANPGLGNNGFKKQIEDPQTRAAVLESKASARA